MIPLFKSHYSTGKSILTLRPKGDSKPEEPDSIVDIATDHNFQEVFLVEDNMSSFLEAYTNLSQEGIKLNYGLRLIVCNDLKEKNAESIATESKIVIFAPNQNAYEQLIKINDKACKEGFYYYPRTDYQSLQEAYENCRDLIFCIPFYDSFIHANCLQNKKCVPQFGNINPVFMLEDNDLPFDDIIAEKILEYNLNDQPKDIIRVKSCYYKNRKDFDAYMTFRCISKRTSLEKPNFEHMCSDEFCFESYANEADLTVKNQNNIKRVAKKIKEDMTETKDITYITLTDEERKEAIKWGKARRLTNLKGELKDRSHSGKHMGKSWLENDVIACGAEIAAARFLGKKFTGTVNTFNDADVDDGWQVRSTDHKDGCLVIRPWKDKGSKLDDKFILVIYLGKRNYRIAGWLPGTDCLKKEYFRAPNGGRKAYFVPQSVLRKDYENA